MPALKLCGRLWHLGSDDVPFFAAWGAIFHCAWVILIAITGQNILNMPEICRKHAGRQHITAMGGLLFSFLAGFCIEVLLIIEGCRGAVFELSKRKNMGLFLGIRAAILALELAFSGYGTYVVTSVHVHCKISEEIIWDPKKEVFVMVMLTWAFQVLTVLNALVWYNAWPERRDPNSWEECFLFLGRCLCCQRGTTSEGQGDNLSGTSLHRRSLRRIARWTSCLLGSVDLTPSDTVLGLVLAAALQRQCRRQRIKEALDKATDEQTGELIPSPAISLLERSRTIHALGLPTHAPGIDDVLSTIQERVASSADSQEVLVDVTEFVAGDSPVRVPIALTAVVNLEAQGTAPAAPLEALLSQGPEPLPDEERATSLVSERAEGAVTGGSPLDKFQRQMETLREATITPSKMEQELAEGRPREEVRQLYTGGHWAVPAADVAELEHFAMYAIGVYSLSSHALSLAECWQNLTSWLWRLACLPFSSASSAAEIGALEERLFQEAVAQDLTRDSCELLYVSMANRFLSHLPYLIALDHTTRSVVVAIRGTYSLEDVITDSVAEPERLLGDWLPADLLTSSPEGDRTAFLVHSGILAAAKAVLQDLDVNGILGELLSENTPEGEAEKGQASQSEASATISRVAESAGGKAAGRVLADIVQRKVDCRRWALVITGHSLGAGAAALIALRLRSRFPNTRCVAFCPPGGLMTTNLAAAVAPFTTSVVVGKDVVSRMSVVNIGRLLDQIVAALALCKLNKNDMLVRRMSKYWRHDGLHQLLWRPQEVPREVLSVLEEYNAGIEIRNRMVEMVPPGRLVFLRPIKRGGARATWDAVWVHGGDIIREGLLISPRMLDDHYCSTLQAALRGAQGHHSPVQQPGALLEHTLPYVPPSSTV